MSALKHYGLKPDTAPCPKSARMPEPEVATYDSASTVNNPSSFITASQRPRGSRFWFMGPSLARSDAGVVYLKPGPPLRGRMITTASAPSGAFSGAMVKVGRRTHKWQGDLSLPQ
jgi:hypothetical protein